MLWLTWKNSEKLSFFGVEQTTTRNSGSGIFIPSIIPCLREKFRDIVSAYRAKNDNLDLAIHLIRNSEFPENIKLLLSPGVDMIYTNLVYT